MMIDWNGFRICFGNWTGIHEDLLTRQTSLLVVHVQGITMLKLNLLYNFLNGLALHDTPPVTSKQNCFSNRAGSTYKDEMQQVLY